MRRMEEDPYVVRQDGAYEAVYNSSDVVVVSIADAGRFQHFRHARLIPDVTQTPSAGTCTQSHSPRHLKRHSGIRIRGVLRSVYTHIINLTIFYSIFRYIDMER